MTVALSALWGYVLAFVAWFDTLTGGQQSLFVLVVTGVPTVCAWAWRNFRRLSLHDRWMAAAEKFHELATRDKGNQWEAAVCMGEVVQVFAEWREDSKDWTVRPRPEGQHAA